MILARTVLEIYNSVSVACGTFDRSLNFDNCQPEVDSDVISGVAVDPRSVKIHVKVGDSRSNRSRDVRLPHFVTNDDNDDVNRRTLLGQTPRVFCLKINKLCVVAILGARMF